MQGRRRTLAVAIAAALAASLTGLMPATAGAALRWSKPETLAPGFPGTVAIDARGDVLAVWHRYYGGTDTRTFYAWRPPRGDWTATRELESARVGVVVAMTPLGQATAAWNDGKGRVVSAEALPGGAFGERQVVASEIEPYATVNLAIDDAGNALIAWALDTGSKRQNAGRTVFAASRRLGGDWSEPEALTGDTAGNGPYVAVNAAGAAAVVWTTHEGGDTELSYRPPAGRFGAPERVPLESPIGPLKLAVDDDGRAVLAAAANVFTNSPLRTQLATRSPVGDWSERFEFDAGGVADTMLAEPTGAVTFLMNDPADPDHPTVQFATRARNGSVLGPITLATDRGSIEGAMNLRGDILAAWHQSPDIGRVEVADRLLGAVFGPAVPVSGPSATEPEVALNDAGQAAVMWAANGYTEPFLEVTVRDDPSLPLLPFPPLLDVEIPALPELDGDGDLVVPVLCSSSCTASPEGILTTGGGAKSRAGSGPSRKLKARRRGALTLDFGANGAKQVRKALKAGRKPIVYVSVRARGKSPRPMTVSRRIRLR